MDYFGAQTRLAKARDPYVGTPIANNTRLMESRVVAGAIGLQLHSTEVVTILKPSRRKARYMLRTGGWETVTTKDRINGALAGMAGVYSIRGDWHVTTREESEARGHWSTDLGRWVDSELEPGEPCAFFEGITLDADGFPYGADLKRGRKLARELATYRKARERERRAGRREADKEARARRRELARLAQERVRAFAEGRGANLTVELSPAQVDYIEANDLTVHEDDQTVTMYKAVGNGWRSGHGSEYTPGSIVTAEDYRATVQCGAGLHFWPKPSLMFAPGGEFPRILKVRVPLETLVPLGDKAKAQSCRVVRELDRHEYGRAGLMADTRRAQMA